MFQLEINQNSKFCIIVLESIITDNLRCYHSSNDTYLLFLSYDYMTDQGILDCYIEKIGYPGIHGSCYSRDEAWTAS